MVEYQIEKLKNGQSYQEIEQVTKDKVSELLSDNKKVLEYALDSIIEALKNEPDSYLLTNKLLTTYNSPGTIPSILYEVDYQLIKERVLDLADWTFKKIRKDMTRSSVDKVLGFEKANSNSYLYYGE